MAEELFGSLECLRLPGRISRTGLKVTSIQVLMDLAFQLVMLNTESGWTSASLLKLAAYRLSCFLRV